MTAKSLARYPIHLGLNATATSEPAFSGDMAWYQDYAERHAVDGAEGRLVSQHTFSTSWDMWEMHPLGSEVVICIDGTMTLIQETDNGESATILNQGDYLINPAGVWHTADVDDAATAIFITAGMGTEHRPRES